VNAKQKKAADWGGKLVGLILFTIGATALFFLGILPVHEWWQAQRWTEVPCTILESEVQVLSDDDGVMYKAHIQYTYRVDGKDFLSERIHFRDGAVSTPDGRERLVAQYPQGAEAVCYVNPADPEQAILVRDFSGLYLIGFPGILFIAAGFYLLLPTARENRGLVPAPPILRGPGPAVRRVTFRSLGLSQLANQIFALSFFNGVAAVFAVIVYFIVQDDGVLNSLPFVLIVGLFVAVALAITARYCYDLWVQWRRKIRLQLRPGYFDPSQDNELQWQLTDPRNRVYELQIWLEYHVLPRNETHISTHTQKDSLIVLSAFEQADIAKGSIRCALPEKGLQSLPENGEKAGWFLCVNAILSGHPNVVGRLPVPIGGQPPSG